jgi:hypothetical protein
MRSGKIVLAKRIITPNGKQMFSGKKSQATGRELLVAKASEKFTKPKGVCYPVRNVYRRVQR